MAKIYFTMVGNIFIMYETLFKKDMKILPIMYENKTKMLV